MGFLAQSIVKHAGQVVDCIPGVVLEQVQAFSTGLTVQASRGTLENTPVKESSFRQASGCEQRISACFFIAAVRLLNSIQLSFQADCVAGLHADHKRRCGSTSRFFHAGSTADSP